ASLRSRTRARSAAAPRATPTAGRARVSSPVYGGTREMDAQEATSSQPPFIHRLCPAETRLKEGAHAHDPVQTGGSIPLPRVGGALSARFRQYLGATLRCQMQRMRECLPAGVNHIRAKRQHRAP